MSEIIRYIVAYLYICIVSYILSAHRPMYIIYIYPYALEANKLNTESVGKADSGRER